MAYKFLVDFLKNDSKLVVSSLLPGDDEEEEGEGEASLAPSPLAKAQPKRPLVSGVPPVFILPDEGEEEGPWVSSGVGGGAG